MPADTGDQHAARRGGKAVNPYMGHLFPAALGTAAFAATAHAAMVAIASRSVGVELLAVAAISFVVALVVALSGGVILLAVTWILRLGSVAALVLFVVVIEGVVVGLEMFVFEIGPIDVSWHYAVTSVPSACLAWYLSIHRVHAGHGRTLPAPAPETIDERK